MDSFSKDTSLFSLYGISYNYYMVWSAMSIYMALRLLTLLELNSRIVLCPLIHYLVKLGIALVDGLVYIGTRCIVVDNIQFYSA